MSLDQRNIKKITKKIVNNILNEEDVAVTGDKVAASGARGEAALEKSKQILSSLGIGVPNLDDIFSVPQLQVEAFQFEFTVQDLKDDPRELTTPQEESYIGLARVIKFDGNLILEFKKKGSDKIFTIEFLKKDVYTNLKGTSKNIPALVMGKQYTVQMGGSFVENLLQQNKTGEVEGEEVENKKKEGGEGKGDKGGNTKNQKNKEQLFNDMSSFFKFVVNNKKFLQTRNESFLGDLEKLLLEEDLPTEEPNVEQKEENKTIVGRILIDGIVLGKQAAEKKKSDIEATFGSGNILTVKQMETNEFYPVTGRITAKVPSGLEQEIVNLFNANQKYEIRKSNKNEGGEQSIVIKLPGKQEFIMVKPKSNEFVNWYSKKPIPIIIGKKALGNYDSESFEGTIQLQKSK